jgi:hypothetical protein
MIWSETFGRQSEFQPRMRIRVRPADTADQVITWTTRLRDLANGRNVDWSDTWTKEDLADARRASLSSLDEREREGA